MSSQEPEVLERTGRGRPGKIGHRKSRNGCMKCKSRRVKCDEVRPTCGNCNRLELDCSWPDHTLHVDHGRHNTSTPSRLTPSPNSQSIPSPSTVKDGITPKPGWASEHSSDVSAWPTPQTNENVFAQLDDISGGSMPESKDRRLMEHRLLHNWHNSLVQTYPVSPAEDWRRIWLTHIPAISLQHENTLCAMLAYSATNLIQSNPDDLKKLFTARQNYLISALHAQREEVAKLTINNAEPVCCASLLISITSFAMVKERSLDPYQPPMEWLQLGRGAGTVIWQSVSTIEEQSSLKDGKHSILEVMATAYPYFGHDKSYFSPEMRRNFEGVLSQHLPSGGDDWTDQETREAYEKTLSYVGSIQWAINSGEPIYAVSRRVQTFALLVPPRFVSLLGMLRPRALVILAHFWATTAQVHNVWWLGGANPTGEESTAKREIRAIKKILPSEWMTTMVWPMDVVGLRDCMPV